VLPVLGREVVERQQRIAVFDQAIGRSVVFDLVGSTKASNAVTTSFLVSASQISCSALGLCVQALWHLVQDIGGPLMTRRWREPDSNPRSRVDEELGTTCGARGVQPDGVRHSMSP
jgi:hypothetical protein